jgi:hypothetical protein
VGDDITLEAAEELERLSADGAEVDLDVLRSAILHGENRRLEQVGVQATAQTAVGRDLRSTQPASPRARSARTAILGMGMGQVRDDVTDLARVRPSRSHAFLCLAHFARRHHFHGFGDFLSTFNTLDFGSYLFGAGHADTRLTDVVGLEIFRDLLQARFDLIVEVAGRVDLGDQFGVVRPRMGQHNPASKSPILFKAMSSR